MRSFPEIFHVGTKYVSDIFKTEVEITEKLDGSHFRFCLDEFGEIEMWGRKAQVFLENTDNNFKPVAMWVQSIKEKLEPGCVYYGETLARTMHNVLKYDATPNNHFCLFGVSSKSGTVFARHGALKVIAESLGCDVVPLLFEGVLDESVYGGINNFFEKMLLRKSYLGGVNIEGFVVKNLNSPVVLTQNDENIKILAPIMCCKFVSEAFKEKHKANSSEYSQGAGDRIALLFNSYKTEARWNKAVQHLRENGELLNDPKDIGKLMKEINVDIIGDSKEEIMEELWKITHKIHGGAFTRGFPEWYKRKLIEK